MRNPAIHKPSGQQTAEYQAWHGLRRRCLDTNDKAYDSYGGRGIQVCERWSSFENFLADMGPRPSANYSLDRTDNHGNYSPDNCRWATRTEQNNNKRLQQNNKSGISGVRWRDSHGRWYAFAQGACIYSGFDFFEACCARKSYESTRSEWSK